MHLLNTKGMSVDDKIDPYLPSNWTRGPGVKALTFKALLSHRSGLKDVGDPNECANLKKALQTGPVNHHWINPAYDYAHCNLAMFRIIIPYLDRQLDMLIFEANGLSEGAINERCSKSYRDHVREHIRLPAGIGNSQPLYTSANQALSYNNLAQQVAGYPVQDIQLYELGAGSWGLLAVEYAKFLAALEDAKILPKPVVQQLKLMRLGLFAYSTELGTAYGHGGSLGGGSQGPYGSARGAWAQTMIFPNNVQVFITINSANNLDPSETA